MYPSLHAIHLISLFGLVGSMFYAFGVNNSETRKQVLKWSGILSLVALLTGLGLLHVISGDGVSSHGWLGVKIICWLAISAVPGVVYRFQGERRKRIFIIGCLAVALAVVMVSFKPF